MRLGVYSDLVYRFDGDTLSTDLSFILFVAGLASRVDELVIFGRLHPTPGRSPYAVPRSQVRFVPLPHYPRVTSIGGMARSMAGARRAFAGELDRLDAVWLFGPHPLALEFARLALRRKVPVFLGVRQDFPRYIASRLPSRRWLWAVPVAHALEQAFRTLARRLPTVVVGRDLGRRYATGAAPLLVTGFSLVRGSEVVSLDNALAKPWDGELRLLTVGRLENDKNPLLLPEVLAALRRRDPRWRLVVVGEGGLAADVRRRADELGLAQELELVGYVPNGPELLERYRESHLFLHVSLTEGLPQVLFEAAASGLPIVATDVGGVRDALGGGSAGVLVPPRDPHAAAQACAQVSEDAELRRRLIAAGLAHAASGTMDAQLDRLAEFFRSCLRERVG
jgi:glycosyltransferase involved in cell wall biosynthesis